MKFRLCSPKEKTSQAIRDALVNKSKSLHKTPKSSINTNYVNTTKFNNQVPDFYPEEITTISHETIKNLSIFSQVCLQETMDDIVTILKSIDNVTKDHAYDNQTKHVIENENWIPMPLDDNDIFTNVTFGEYDDFLSELKHARTESPSLNSITDEDNSLSLIDFLDLSQTDIQYILNEWV